MEILGERAEFGNCRTENLLKFPIKLRWGWNWAVSGKKHICEANNPLLVTLMTTKKQLDNHESANGLVRSSMTLSYFFYIKGEG